MERIETKVTINVLGSINGLKVRRGAKPGLLVEDENNNLYLFSHNRGLNNYDYSGNKKRLFIGLGVWQYRKIKNNRTNNRGNK